MKSASQIPSGFNSALLKKGSWGELNKRLKLSDIKLETKAPVRTKKEHSASKVQDKSKVGVTRIRSDQPTCLLKQEDETIPEVKASAHPGQPLKVKGKMKAKKKQKNCRKSVSKSANAPTIMMAPKDYQHIYKGKHRQVASKGKGKIKGKGSRKMVAMPSDAPTALIAPSDNQHIYQEPEEKMKGQGAPDSSKKQQSHDPRKDAVSSLYNRQVSSQVHSKSQAHVESGVNEQQQPNRPQTKVHQNQDSEAGCGCCVLM